MTDKPALINGNMRMLKRPIKEIKLSITPKEKKQKLGWEKEWPPGKFQDVTYTKGLSFQQKLRAAPRCSCACKLWRNLVSALQILPPLSVQEAAALWVCMENWESCSTTSLLSAGPLLKNNPFHSLLFHVYQLPSN